MDMDATEIMTEVATETVTNAQFEIKAIVQESMNDMIANMIPILAMFFTIAVILTVIVEFGKKLLRNLRDTIRRL